MSQHLRYLHLGSLDLELTLFDLQINILGVHKLLIVRVVDVLLLLSRRRVYLEGRVALILARNFDRIVTAV
jgi:hypothetical protein